MPLVVGDLEPRKLEQWRAEIGELLAAQLAYPPYFDYRAGHELVRPLDRAKREEIEQFVRSVNFASLERTDASSPEVRRFLEQLLRRYVDVNPSLRHQHSARRIPSLRERVPRLAAEVHRGLLAFLAGTANGFGARRPPRSWSGQDQQAQLRPEGIEHNTRVLEAVLVRRADEPMPAMPAVPPIATGRAPAPAAASRGWAPGASQATVPVPSSGLPSPGSGSLPSLPTGSPFASLASGAQSPIFGTSSIDESPTGPLAVPVRAGQAAQAGAGMPEDLYQLYGDYLRDMQPEAFSRAAPPPAAMPVTPPPAARQRTQEPPPRQQPPPAPVWSPPPTPGAPPREAHGDLLIFFQLRYQLEAYIRRAARSYGVQARSDDPSGVLDALRRSGFVDEADLRLAEGILAATDRVTASGMASVEDYRQALMLYLLYHRSHLDG
jgi:hypothetical protein